MESQGVPVATAGKAWRVFRDSPVTIPYIRTDMDVVGVQVYRRVAAGNARAAGEGSEAAQRHYSYSTHDTTPYQIRHVHCLAGPWYSQALHPGAVLVGCDLPFL